MRFVPCRDLTLHAQSSGRGLPDLLCFRCYMEHEPLAEVRIAANKVKTAIVAIVAIVFAAGGLGMLGVSVFGAAMVWTTAVIGLVSAAFFGPIAVGTVRKLFDARPGLLVDAEGIVDNSSGGAAGRIPWSEITAISTSFLVGQRYVNVHVIDPERFLVRGTRVQRFFRRRNMAMIGTPISISPNGLAVNFDALEAALVRGFERYGRMEDRGLRIED